jgi:MSHA pilin protein MshD
MCVRSKGFTLVEIVVLIVVVAAALVGVLLVFQNTVRGSADPQVRKQALAIAEAMLDEILLASYDPLPGGGGARSNFNDVDDYLGYDTAGGGMRDIEDNLIAGLAAYNVGDVAVATVTLSATGPGPAVPNVAEAKRVTVTVTGPQGFSITLDGYRLNYAAP